MSLNDHDKHTKFKNNLFEKKREPCLTGDKIGMQNPHYGMDVGFLGLIEGNKSYPSTYPKSQRAISESQRPLASFPEPVRSP